MFRDENEGGCALIPDKVISLTISCASGGKSISKYKQYNQYDGEIKISLAFSCNWITLAIVTGRWQPVPATKTKKFTPEIDAQLYEEFVTVAKQNGQNQRFLLERALEFYLHNVVPSQRLVRSEVMEASRRSNEQYRELYQKLAGSK